MFAQPKQTDPKTNSEEAKILDLPDIDGDPAKIDYAKLPLLKGTHAVVSRPDEKLKFQLHNYLLHHDGRYWCMWSQGPPVEDEPGQQIRYATSDDGLKWSEAKDITGLPKEGYGYIARGLWVRDGELLALVASFKGKGAFGVNKELQLQAFVWDAKPKVWKFKGPMFDNAINNFPPQKLSTGEWMMTRRDARFNVYMLIGGVKAIDDWQSIPVIERLKVKGFSPDEPVWAQVSENKLMSLIRDNGGSNRLYQSFSTDNGKTWSIPVKTNYPNSSSKLYTQKLSLGCRVLISNANPTLGRRQMHLSLSENGEAYTRMTMLDIPSPKPATLQYPHAIEHDGHLLVAFSRNKNTIELLKIPLKEIEAQREKK